MDFNVIGEQNPRMILPQMKNAMIPVIVQKIEIQNIDGSTFRSNKIASASPYDTGKQLKLVQRGAEYGATLG